jgi:hypothetical protein
MHNTRYWSYHPSNNSYGGQVVSVSPTDWTDLDRIGFESYWTSWWCTRPCLIWQRCLGIMWTRDNVQLASWMRSLRQTATGPNCLKLSIIEGWSQLGEWQYNKWYSTLRYIYSLPLPLLGHYMDWPHLNSSLSLFSLLQYSRREHKWQCWPYMKLRPVRTV